LDKVHYIFILNKKNPDNFWKNCCASKIFPQVKGVTYAGYKMPQGFHICYPCWVYCQQGKKAGEEEDYQEPESPVEAVKYECACESNLNVKCRFNSFPNYFSDPSIVKANLNSVDNFIDDEKLNFDKKKEERVKQKEERAKQKKMMRDFGFESR